MSTIRSTSDAKLDYTVVGGRRVDRRLQAPRSVTLLLLNRGTKLDRPQLFRNLEALKVDEVVSVEGPSATYDVEALSNKLTKTRFILLKGETSPGQQINIGIDEARGKFVYVVWNTTTPGPIPPRLVERIKDERLLCVVPIMRNERSELIPTIQAPAFFRNRLRVVPIPPSKDGTPSLYPFDYMGIYDKDRFQRVGGFDPAIETPYWQKLDFGFRAHMWGEHIVCATSLRAGLKSRDLAEDTTPDDSYSRFYLKNLSIRFNGDSGDLPRRKFLQFYLRTGGGLAACIQLFRRIRRWVSQNRFRFTQDAKRVTELWEDV